ncbi:DEAD/DEAH box helicase [Enterococcus bulliens]
MQEGKVHVVPFDKACEMRRALQEIQGNFHCQRCNFLFQFPKDHPMIYCPNCARYGKVTIQDGLMVTPSDHSFQSLTCQWEGTLTKAQEQVADALLIGVKQKQDQLVWAVTGAGKTEMMFPIIEYSLNQGGRVVIASPRIDVCLELFPRLSTAFPQADSLLLYGKATEKYRYTNLTICTTHQLIHFYHAFDLLILDEADAFPYEGDPLLLFAQQQAIKPGGVRIFLSATPSKLLLSELSKTTQILTLPRRFHGRKLPVPRLYFDRDWQQIKGMTRRKLIRLLDNLAKKQFTLVFCPSIALVEQVFQVLHQALPNFQIERVHANESLRQEIVTKARQKAYHILVTTTILERGVTFDAVSVVVLAADHSVYSKSALVQIAGRVDRKGNIACGEVWFLHRRKTAAIKKACTEIKRMNQLAKDDEV